jgi:hypothetical protein
MRRFIPAIVSTLLALSLSACFSIPHKPAAKPAETKPAVPALPPQPPVLTCATASRDPVILTACMDFGPDPLTMDDRYSRVKSCILFADEVYAGQLRLNRAKELTQSQWNYIETYRVKELTLCVRFGRDHFPSDIKVKHSKENLIPKEFHESVPSVSPPVPASPSVQPPQPSTQPTTQ